MILPGLINYWVVVFLMMSGFYVVMSTGNLVKKMVGLTLFQTSVFIFSTHQHAMVFVGFQHEMGSRGNNVIDCRQFFADKRGHGMQGGPLDKQK